MLYEIAAVTGCYRSRQKKFPRKHFMYKDTLPHVCCLGNIIKTVVYNKLRINCRFWLLILILSIAILLAVLYLSLISGVRSHPLLQ